MRLSAMDIRQQQFAVKLLRGFDPQEVDAFLDEVADDWEELVRENNLLKEQLVSADEQKKAVEEEKKATEERYRELQQTLVVAQKMAEEFRESGKRAADILLREAQLQAEKLLEEKRQEQTQLSADVLRLKDLKRQAGQQLLNELHRLAQEVERLVDAT